MFSVHADLLLTGPAETKPVKLMIVKLVTVKSVWCVVRSQDSAPGVMYSSVPARPLVILLSQGP